MADTNTRQGKRTPVTLKIKFKSETLEQFIERYAVDVSQGGIFIRTKDPLAVGTQMKFEFQLRDASPLIAGEGTVVWTRENDPSRPAIAPGMGVRFDRLADGSQTVLEKILAEKAKQAPSRSANQTAPGDSSKAAMFTDTPTRVAPAPVQEALGVRGRNRADSEQTPLPKPMPFHSDAEDFDESAFAEATKIRSLDELALHSVGMDTGDGMMNDAAEMTKIMPADELSVRRQAGRGDATISDPPLASPPEEARIPIDRDSAPGLPSPPAVEPSRSQRMLDTTPSPRIDPPARPSQPSTPPMSTHGSGSGTPSPSESQRTQVGLGNPKTTSQPMPKVAAATESAVPRAVSAEPSHPIAPSRPSSAPIILGILVVVAAAMGAVYWFVLRDPGTSNNTVVETTPGSAVTPGSGSGVAMGSDQGSAVAMAGSGSDDAGSAAGSAMAGSNEGSAVVPAGPTVDTVISASARGATVEIVGTDMKGPSPFTAKLEKDKPYKARISAAGFTLSEIDVKGGERTTAKLVLKPRVVSVSTDPAGASIYVDNVDTGKVTPDSVTLSAAQAGRARVRISLRRTGFRSVDTTVEAAAFKDEGGTMTSAVAAKLTVQQVVRPNPNPNPNPGTGAGSGSAGTGTGSAGTGTGSATTPPTGTGTGSATPLPAGTGTGSATKPTTGTGTGSATPTPTPAPPTSSGGGLPTELK